MHRNYKNLLAAFSLLAILFQSCIKEPSELGLEITPPGDKLDFQYCDTISVSAYSVLEDSIITSSLTTNLLGSIYDPVFGKTTASLYAQFRMSTSDNDFGTDPVVDSTVLKLQYKGYYGEIKTPQHFKVYELSEDLKYYSDDDNTIKKYYYSTSTVSHYSQPIADYRFTPRPNDSLTIDGDVKAPHLRIRLSNEFGQNILNADPDSFEEDSVFVKKVLKGICIISEPVNSYGKGAILSFNPTGTHSELVIYYHNSSDTSTFTLAIKSSYSPYFNHYEHYGYQGAEALLRRQLRGDTLAGNDKLYIQAMGGVKVQIQFPDIRKMIKSGKIAINQAELVLKIADNHSPSPNKPFAPPSSLSLVHRIVRENQADTTQTMEDQEDGNDYFNGNLDANNEYRFRISTFIQSLLSDNPPTNKKLWLYSKNTAYRTILNGAGNPDGKLKLELYYTPLK